MMNTHPSYRFFDLLTRNHLLLLFCLLGACLSYASAQQPNAPYQAFLGFRENVLSAKNPDQIMDQLAEKKVERSKEIQENARQKELKFLKNIFRGMDIVRHDTKAKGRLAILRLKGIDRRVRVPATWNVTMVKEEEGWKYRSMEVDLERSTIDKRMRTWKLGKDQTEVKAMLHKKTEDEITLVLENMRMVTLPLKELSTEDLRHLANREKSVEQELREARKRLKNAE